MAKGDVVKISGPVLEWARERAGIDKASLATKMGKGYSPDHITAWEDGSSLPTFVQAEKLADQLRVPFGILFMKEPPPVSLPIPDLRTITSPLQSKPSLEFLDVLNDCLVRQRWYHDDQLERGAEKLRFVGKFTAASDPHVVAADIAATLSVNNAVRDACDTWQGFLSALVDRAEAAGVLVMRSSVVRHASRYGLSVDEFRGFAISDPLAPVIFVNSRDALSAQIFTLAHELAHIWIGQSGISNADPKRRLRDFHQDVERFCNTVAAEFLVPEANARRLWKRSDTPDANLRRVAIFHRVSKTAAAIRARELGLITPDAADRIIEAENRRFAELKEKQKERDSGPSFWTTFTPRNSLRLTDAVVTALGEGRVPYRDAANLLGIKAEKLQAYVTTR